MKVWFVVHNKLFILPEFREFVEQEQFIESSEEFEAQRPDLVNELEGFSQRFELQMTDQLSEILSLPTLRRWLSGIETCMASVWVDWNEGIRVGSVPIRLSRTESSLDFGLLYVDAKIINGQKSAKELTQFLVNLYKALLCLRAPRKLRQLMVHELEERYGRIDFDSAIRQSGINPGWSYLRNRAGFVPAR